MEKYKNHLINLANTNQFDILKWLITEGFITTESLLGIIGNKYTKNITEKINSNPNIFSKN